MRRLALLAPLFCALSTPVPAAETDSRVRLDTSEGAIVLELYADKAPATVENFLAYVKAGHYDGTVFHRVIPGFMIQGGGFEKTAAGLSEKATREPVRNEADNGLRNERGTVAMARTNDPHSATAQFFINTVNNPSLNHRAPRGPAWGYTVFGRVVDGMDVVDRISATPTGRGTLNGYPTGDVPIRAVTIVRAQVEAATDTTAE